MVFMYRGYFIFDKLKLNEHATEISGHITLNHAKKSTEGPEDNLS